MYRPRSHRPRFPAARGWIFGSILLILAAVPAWADDGEFRPSINDFGNTGLLQMPNARFHADGGINLGVSHISPYTRGYLTVQGLPWLEGTFRYTDIANRLFSNDPDFSGDQSFKDRGADLKVRLIEESAYFPQVALLLRDLGGTDLFGSEFLIFSRRYYGWDFTAGTAWGNGGSRGHVRNPFGYVHDGFNTRGGSSGAGNIGLDFFRGERVAFFGGIEYLTPLDGLRVKVEYDGNSYQDEPLGNRFEVNFPVNFGLEYDLFPWFRLAAAFERGNRFMIRGNLSANLHSDKGPRKLDPRPPRIPQRARIPKVETSSGVGISEVPPPVPSPSRAQLAKRLRRLGLDVADIRSRDRTIVIRLSASGAPPTFAALADGALAASRSYPDRPLDAVTFTAASGSRDLSSVTYTTAELERSVALTGSPLALLRPPPGKWLALFSSDEAGHRPAGGADPGTPRIPLKEIAAKVFEEVKRQGFEAEHFSLEGKRATLLFSQNKYRNPAKAIGRAARAVVLHTPPEVEEISLVLSQAGVPVSQTTVLRKDVEDALRYRGSPEEMWHNAAIEDARSPHPGKGVARKGRHPKFDWSIAPQTRQQIGGPDEFLLFQAYGRGLASVALTNGLSLTGGVGVNMYNNFDKLELESNSRLPRVRSNIGKYLKEGEQWIDQLHMDYLAKLAPNLYGRASAGIFELMFAGVGVEALYRPHGARWAVGVDVNYVKQRDFDGLFGLQDYEVLTGHVSYYHRLPFYEVLATVRAGRYLAGDVGATLDLSRTFDNGVTVGAFATKTDVSASEFGEGAFDKGFYISIPLDLFFTSSSRRRSTFLFRPVTRDGGQRLILPKPLYAVTAGADYGRIGRGWNEVMD